VGITYPRPGNPSVSVSGAGTDDRSPKAAYGTAAEWTAANPTLAVGELGFETDTGVYKVGDGTTAWSSLNPALVNTFSSSDTGMHTPPIQQFPFPATSIITTFQSGHGYTVSAGGTGGDNLNYTTDYVLGTQCVKLVTDGAGTAKRLDKASLTFDTTNKHPVIWIKFDDITHLSGYEIWFGNGGLTNYYRLSSMNSTPPNVSIEHLRSGEWMRIVIPWSTLSLVQTNGSPTRANGTNIRIQILDDGTGNPVTAYVNGLGLQDAPAASFPTGVVSMTFDDSYGTQYTAAKSYMDKYGFPGTAYTIVESVVAGGSNLTLTQLRNMQDLSGWEVAGHAYSLTNHNTSGGLTGLTSAVAEKDVADSRKWLLQNGFSSTAFAYPQGYHSSSVEAVIKKYFNSGRTISSRVQESMPPSQPGRLRVRVVTSATATSTVIGWIDEAYTYGTWLILVFHSIDDTSAAGGNSYTVANFQTVTDYLNTKGIPVRTISEVLNTRPVRHGASHAPGGLDDTWPDGGVGTSAGIETMHRYHATQGATTATQRLMLTHFTPRFTKNVSQFTFCTGGTNSTGLTVGRVGLYTLSTAGVYTLVAASLNDTTLGNSASTVYTKSFDTGGSLPSTYTLQAGVRYAVGFLFVGTPASIYGIVPLLTTVTAYAPSMGAFLNTQSDLPTSISAGTVSAGNNLCWVYLS
jgi:peptidoglycan/xylan/chitin deacetylase (PgdA/CDA1 family)